MDNSIRCVACGRFMRPGAPGASCWQTWSYNMDGSPGLNDAVFQCSPCTDRYGYEHSNCATPWKYQWRNPMMEQGNG